MSFGIFILQVKFIDFYSLIYLQIGLSFVVIWMFVLFSSSSTHEKKTKTYVIVKHEKYYLKHNSFSEVGHL